MLTTEDREAATPVATTVTARPTPQERRAMGKSLRAEVPLEAQAAVTRMPGSTSPLTLLEEQGADRVPELVPIRWGRMLQSPFAFYRGAARVMAADLAGAPRSGLTVQMCGDAHVSNFGLFASPERRLVFDTNDFDETLPGPFEHDVKRLVASLVIAGRAKGMGRKQRRALAAGAAAAYRAAMARFAGMRDIEVWYSHVDADEINTQLAPELDPKPRKRLAQALEKARTRDTMQAFGKLTDVDGGRLQIRADPPLLVPLRDLVTVGEERYFAEAFPEVIRQYRGSLQADRRTLLERYAFVDMARKVVGVGSVGTRCWVVLLVGRDADDPLLLQVKEAVRSVHAEYVGRSRYTNQGQRVVTGQRMMQQASDIFLGWQRTTGIDGAQHDFYVRQLRDWKGTIEVDQLRPAGLKSYGELCAWCLARAHARSGDRIAIAGYLGSSPAFDEAMADFGEAYDEVNERDHRALADAVSAGRITAEVDV